VARTKSKDKQRVQARKLTRAKIANDSLLTAKEFQIAESIERAKLRDSTPLLVPRTESVLRHAAETIAAQNLFQKDVETLITALRPFAWACNNVWHEQKRKLKEKDRALRETE
jgi:hypothetical protein